MMGTQEKKLKKGSRQVERQWFNESALLWNLLISIPTTAGVEALFPFSCSLCIT
jgi:hypothetical protein